MADTTAAPAATAPHTDARRDRLLMGDLVEVESCDDGFEGCFCEATVNKQLRSKALPDGRQLRMYEVRYSRLVGARGKPILEAVCEHRVRLEPPEVLGYAPKLHDFVDAYWWDGWWQGYVTHVDEGEKDEGRVVHVRFPSVKGQMLRLEAKNVRQHVRYDTGAAEWQKKVAQAPAADKEASAASAADKQGADALEQEHAWVKLLPSEILERRNTAKKRARARSSREVEKEANEKRARDKAPMPDLPECPTLYPTAEEFADPYKYIAQIREQVEPYGLCKVVPPTGWAPSWPIDSENFRFQTRIQNVHQLQERGEFAFWKQLKESLAKQNKPLKVVPRLNGKQVRLAPCSFVRVNLCQLAPC